MAINIAWLMEQVHGTYRFCCKSTPNHKTNADGDILRRCVNQPCCIVTRTYDGKELAREYGKDEKDARDKAMAKVRDDHGLKDGPQTDAEANEARMREMEDRIAQLTTLLGKEVKEKELAEAAASSGGSNKSVKMSNPNKVKQ